MLLQGKQHLKNVLNRMKHEENLSRIKPKPKLNPMVIELDIDSDFSEIVSINT